MNDEIKSTDGSGRKPTVDPLHGITLEVLLNELVAQYGWDELGYRIRINCFTADPSVRSSLKFLRKTPWARHKVERLYVSTRVDTPANEPTEIGQAPTIPV